MSVEILSVRARDGTSLAVGAHVAPASGPVVLALHGIASHMGWYHGLAAALATRGLSVYLQDRRGCGLSGGVRGHMRSWGAVVDDVGAVADALMARHPGQPLHVLGVSLGAAFSLAASIRRPGLFRSQVLLSPGLASSIRIPWHRRIQVVSSSSALPRTRFDIPFTLGQFTDRPEWQRVLEHDPLRTRRVTARFLAQTFLLQRFVRMRAAGLDVPILALLAGRDALIDNEMVIAALSRAASRVVRIEVHEEASHILAASLPRNVLPDRLSAWFAGEQRPWGSVEAERVTVERIPTAVVDSADLAPPPPLDAAESV